MPCRTTVTYSSEIYLHVKFEVSPINFLCPMINLHRVSKVYPPEQPALRSISIKLKQGEFVFVAGASGAGKSTLLRILFGAERATEGEVVVGGRNLQSIEASGIAALRQGMGFIFQDYKLLSRRTVLDNVAFGLEVQGVSVSGRRSLAMHMLESIGLADRAEALPRMLSGGEQQRVAVARALLHQPKIILADEPTGNLDREMTRVVFDMLLEAHAAGCTVVVATHDLAMIEDLNMRTIVLDRGRIIGDFERFRGVS